ncbi:MAG: PIN domain-containing protein [Geminicoccaceae bacterium]
MTAERFALDTNLLAYTRDDSVPDKQARARDVFWRAICCGRCLLSIQTVGELYASLRRRGAVPVAAAIETVREMTSLFPVIGIVPEDAERALRAAAAGTMSYWDGLMVATVGRAGCTTLLTEDMQDGAVHGGVIIRNPFAGKQLPAEIVALLG